MKKYGKQLAIICAVVLAVSCLLDEMSISGYFPLVKRASAEMEYRAELREGDLVEAVLSTEEMITRTAVYKFVPEETDVYEFYSVSNFATAARLYNSNGQIVQSDLLGSGRGGNFLLQYEFVAGSTYYLEAQLARSASENGTIWVGLRRMLRESDFSSTPSLTESAQGIECEITEQNRIQRYCIVPTETAVYNIFTGDACGDAEADCDCLHDVAITVYTKEEDQLEIFCYGSSHGARGALARTLLEAGETYYVEFTSEDQQKTGAFMVYLNTSSDLGTLPLPDYPEGETVEGILENSTESLYYRIQPEKTGVYQFSSQRGQNLYMKLYNEQMETLKESSEYEDNFTVLVTLKQEQTYYLQLSTLSSSTFEFETMVQYLREEDPEPPVITPPPEDDDSSAIKTPQTGQNKNETYAIGSVSVGEVKDQPYNGKAKKPSLVLKRGSYSLVLGKDYKVSYKNNKAIGTATITIQGIGSYTGSRTAKFLIVPAKVALKKSKRSNKKLKLAWKKVKGAGGYEINYATSKKFKKAKTVKVKKGSKVKTTLKLKNKKKQYVRIRAYKTVKGKKYVGAYSKIKRY